MAKLRKMLGKADDPMIVTLMRQIETQNVRTLAAWAADWVQERSLPMVPEDGADALCALLDTVRACLAGQATQKQLREQLRAARKIAMEDPAAQAAVRAIVTACGVLQTPTNALGFCFYAAAAAAYHELGVTQTAAAYDARAQREFTALSARLAAVSVVDEADPVAVDWNC